MRSDSSFLSFRKDRGLSRSVELGMTSLLGRNQRYALGRPGPTRTRALLCAERWARAALVSRSGPSVDPLGQLRPLVWIVAEHHAYALVAQLSHLAKRAQLLLLVPAVRRRLLAVEPVGEITRVADEQGLAREQDRLVAGGMSGGRDRHDLAVTEQVVVPFDGPDSLAVVIVTRDVEVALDLGRVVRRRPFGLLDDDRDRVGDQPVATGVVEVE